MNSIAIVSNQNKFKTKHQKKIEVLIFSLAKKATKIVQIRKGEKRTQTHTQTHAHTHTTTITEI